MSDEPYESSFGYTSRELERWQVSEVVEAKCFPS
jgi:hypothetical protein